VERHITISLQFPNHGHKPVKVRLYEAGVPGKFRVKIGHAYDGKEGVELDTAMRLAADEIRRVLGLPVQEPEPEPMLRLGQLVTLPGEWCHVSAGDMGKRGGVESQLFRVATPPVRCWTGEWVCFVARSPRFRPELVRCRDLRPACGRPA
jgi:hypothetical protein